MLEWIQAIDENILLWIGNHRLPVLNGGMVAYTTLGNAGMIFIAAAILLLFFRKTRRAGGTALLAMIFGLLVTNLTLKPLVSRLRPWVVMEGFQTLVRSSDLNSFPSGHTCAAFAFAAALWCALPGKWGRAAAIIFAVLMGYSRLYVGVHFPSDVLAGALVGILCGLAANWVAGKASARFRSHRSDLPPRQRP